MKMTQVKGEIKKRLKFLTHAQKGRLIGRKAMVKTEKWTVQSIYFGDVLGYVKWHSPWRQYVFECCDVILGWDCLLEISEFCHDQTRAHLAECKAKRIATTESL